MPSFYWSTKGRIDIRGPVSKAKMNEVKNKLLALWNYLVYFVS